GVAGALVPVGQPDLGQPVLVAQHQRDLLEVQAEQGLQLTDPRHPGQVVGRVPAHAAGRGAGRDQQADLLVIAQRPGGHPGPGGRLADAQQPLARGRAGCRRRSAAGAGGRAGRGGHGRAAGHRAHPPPPDPPADGRPASPLPYSVKLADPVPRPFPMLGADRPPPGMTGSSPASPPASAAPSAISSGTGSATWKYARPRAKGSSISLGKNDRPVMYAAWWAGSCWSAPVGPSSCLIGLKPRNAENR